jgi:hypothetical protein
MYKKEGNMYKKEDLTFLQQGTRIKKKTPLFFKHGTF